jgi:hypothetical protein
MTNRLKIMLLYRRKRLFQSVVDGAALGAVLSVAAGTVAGVGVAGGAVVAAAGVVGGGVDDAAAVGAAGGALASGNNVMLTWLS